ncbi:MAG: hypothetical protein FWE49_00240 [Synergistaceae bacterium]|nr:hypothetical protein [Synergistaceae bacterium]
MVNREDIRKYFSRYFLGRIPVHSFCFSMHKMNVLNLNRNIEVYKGVAKARIISPLQFSCGKLACVNSSMKMKSLSAKIKGDKIKSYAPGEIKSKEVSLKIAVHLRKWRKQFALLPQERRNRLSFIPINERVTEKNEFNLAYFQPIIHDNVSKLVLNKQNGSLFIWYNSINRSFDPKGLYMYKRLGDKDIDWRWIEIGSQSKN